MRDVLEILAYVVLAGMVLLHPLVALSFIAAAVVMVLILFAVMFHLLGGPSGTNDH